VVEPRAVFTYLVIGYLVTKAQPEDRFMTTVPVNDTKDPAKQFVIRFNVRNRGRLLTGHS
jgi:hypothetical protein